MAPKKKANVEKSVISAAPDSAKSATSSTTPSNGTTAAHLKTPKQQPEKDPAAATSSALPPVAALPPCTATATTTTPHRMQNIRNFYETGCFLTPPRTYAELLRAYVEFVLYCAPAPASTAGATPATPASPTAAAGTTTATLYDLETQVQTLLFVAVPHRVASFFAEIPLEVDDGTENNSTGGVPEKSTVRAEGRGRKRERAAITTADNADEPEKDHTNSSCIKEINGEGKTGKPGQQQQQQQSEEHPHCTRNTDSAEADTATACPNTMLRRLVAYGAAHLPGFTSDSAYLAAKDVLLYVKHYAYIFTGMGLSASLLKSIEVAKLDFRRQCVPCVEAVLRLVEQLTTVQRTKMPVPPRLVRLCTRLQLSAKAAQTLEYLLVCHCGRYTPGAIAEPLRPVNIAYHNDLTPQELLSILSESGVLWKQGLAFSDVKLRASFMDCKYALPLETIAALSGDQLSEEQLIKLERTALSEVLSEEKQLKAAQSLAPALNTPSTTTPTTHNAPKTEIHHTRHVSPAVAGRRQSATAGVSGSPSRRSSRSPLPRRRGDADAGEEEEAEEAGDGEDFEETASMAESTLTLTDDALDDALDHVDPAILASGDEAAIQEAVALHLSTLSAKVSGKKTTKRESGDVNGKKTGGERPEKEEEEEKNIAGSSKKFSDKQSAEEARSAHGSKTDEEATAAPSAPAQNAREGGDATGAISDGTATATATAAPAEAEAAAGVDVASRKPQLTLAEINPLAQRYRHGTASANPGASPQTDSAMRDTPYDSDIEYMDAAFRILANIIRIRYAEGDMKDEEDTYTPKNKVEASLRELKGKVRVAAAVHESRLQATLAANTFTPRIEQLARRLKLTEMEKQIMLFMVGNVISHDMLVAVNGRYVMRDGQRLITVGYMLFVLCETLEERVVARRAFYQSAPLVSNGVLSLSFESSGRSCFNTDLMDYLVDIDRKIVDDVMGIVAETAEMVPGSQLYFPSVELANVVLPTATMDRVLSTIEHYSLFEQCKKKSGFGEGLGTSKGGLVMLFFGPSGTGKTMLANAVAHHLHKKILLVSISQFRSSTKAESDALKFLFREAKLSDAIIFFDECESLFEDRNSNATVTALLSEFERYDGLIILATNKAQNFDEAMNRRISLMMEFRPPDHQLRLRIWKSHIPKQLTLADDVSLEKLALNYELSGGLIRNAVLAALNQAVAREKSASPTLTMGDLDEGARLQLRGFFLAAERPEGMSEFYVTPKRTLAELVLEAPLAKKLEAIASVAKSRSTLYTQWGFSEDANDDCGALYLFQGVSGTGKSLAAEGIAYECGATIRLCNVAELLLREEMRVHAVFEEGRRLGAIIIFDEAQVLFNESPKSLQLSQLIQYHARRYPRPVIVIATTTSRDGGGGRQLFSTTSINSRSSCMLFQSEVNFVLPSRQLREQLWRRAFPERVPVAPDVDYGKLSAASISPKLIRTVAFGVCCKAALLPVAQRTVTMAMIEKEVEKALVRERSSVSASAMFA